MKFATVENIHQRFFKYKKDGSVSENLESQHEEGDTYSVDGTEYADFREALKNLKEPT